MKKFYNFLSFPEVKNVFKWMVFSLLLLQLSSRSIRFVDAWKPRHFPKIGISEFAIQDEENHHHVWETDIEKMPEGALTITDNGQTYLVSQPILALTIDCNASYPVEWNFLNAEEAGDMIYSVRIRMFRDAKDVYNPLTNTFSSQLQIVGETNAITGQYICYSAEYQDIQKKIYVYWQGDSPSPLIPQEKIEDVCIKKDNTAVLPCRVSEPDARPKLYFEVKCNDKFKTLDSPYIKYDSRIGYTIDISQYDGAFGRYKCSMNDDDSFPAYFNLRNESCPPRVFNDTIESGASIRYSKKDQKIICCSNSQKPPALEMIFCFDPVACKMRDFRLFKNGDNSMHTKTGNCAYSKIYERDSGLLRCKGDGIDVMRPFYTDLQPIKNENFNLYFDWNALQPEKLITVTVSARKTMYERQNITVNCELSYFYFAEGVKWAIRWKNGTLQFLGPNYGLEQISVGSLQQTIRLQLHRNMTEILCFAPVWNATDWINKTYSLNVKASTPPKFDSAKPAEEIINLNLNSTEQIVICNASGTPSPALRWRKNHRTVLNENNYALKRKNSSLYMTIHRVSHETQGEYTCVATNLAGRVERIVKIYVIDPGQPLSATAILFVFLLVIVLVGGVGFLLWRMQLQRKIITHLTGIVFRDMSGTGASSHNNTSSTNTVVVSATNERNGQPVLNGGSNAQIINESNHI